MNRLGKRSFVLLLGTAIVIFSINSCKFTDKESADCVFTFIIGEVLHNGVAATVGSKIKKTDLVEVKKDSTAIIQVSSDVQMTIRSNTSVRLNTLNIDKTGKTNIGLFQKYGSTFNKIVKNRANHIITTPTIVVAVRGTSYNLTVGKTGNSQVKMLKGKVELKPEKGAGEPVVIESGDKVTVTDKGPGEVEKLTGEEIESLSKIDEIPVLPKDKLGKESLRKEPLSIPGEVLTETRKEQVIRDENKKEIKKKPVTLNDIKKKYGRLVKITTKDGKTYVGAYKQSGARMRIITTRGTITIPTSKVSKVTPYK